MTCKFDQSFAQKMFSMGEVKVVIAVRTFQKWDPDFNLVFGFFPDWEWLRVPRLGGFFQALGPMAYNFFVRDLRIFVIS